MAGGGGSETTTQKTEPWDKQKPYLEYGFKQAQDLYKKTNPEYYPGSTVVPFSPETNLSLEMQTQRALNGSPIQQAANQQLVSTMNGEYLYGGDGFNAAVDAATRRALPQINSTFEMAGRSNSGLADVAKTQAIADSFAGQYAGERQNQMRSMLFAPEIANQDFENISKLAEVGTAKEQLAQQHLTSDIDRFNFNQSSPWSELSDYLGMIQGTYGGSTTTTQPKQGGGWASLAGGGLGLLSLFL